MKVDLPVTIAIGTGDSLRWQADRSVGLRPDSNRYRPAQARALNFLQAKELASDQRHGDFRPPLRWGLNE